MLIVHKYEVSGITGTISLEVHSLSRKVDALIGSDCVGWRQSLLCAAKSPLHRGLEAAVDPETEVIALLKLPFEQKNSFQQDQIDVIEFINMLAIAGGRLFYVFGGEMAAAVARERLDQARNHFFEAECVRVEVLAWIITPEADKRQIQPSVSGDHRNAKSFTRQLLGQPGRDISFPRSVNTTDGEQAGPAPPVESHAEDHSGDVINT